MNLLNFSEYENLLLSFVDDTKFQVSDEVILFTGLKSSSILTKEELYTKKFMAAGILLCFAFNHYAAIDCFKKVLNLSSIIKTKRFGFANWWIAYALGENYNKKFVAPNDILLSKYYLKEARKLAIDSNYGNKLQSLLIDALSQRCFVHNNDKQLKSSELYANKFNYIYTLYSNNDSIICLYAESLMNIHAWNIWNKDVTNNATSWNTYSSNGLDCSIAEVVMLVLDKGLEKYPSHPGLCHLYIHLMELGPKFLTNINTKSGDLVNINLKNSCEVLRKKYLVLGHLSHMPSHIDMINGGHEGYYKTIIDNEKASKADSLYCRLKCSDNNFNLFYYGYWLHNEHMITWAAMFTGAVNKAMASARFANETISNELLTLYPDNLEAYLAIEWHVYIRFGLWEEIIAKEIPPSNGRAVCLATCYYSRGLAYAALGKSVEARQELKLFQEAKINIPSTRILHNVLSSDTMNIAEQMLYGEILYRETKYTEAFEHLRKAVAFEMELPYDEPAGWMIPTRHALGALLLEEAQRRYRCSSNSSIGSNNNCCSHPSSSIYDGITWKVMADEARYIYELDLLAYPGNLWSLTGLRNYLLLKSEAKNDKVNSSENVMIVEKQLEEATKYADESVSLY